MFPTLIYIFSIALGSTLIAKYCGHAAKYCGHNNKFHPFPREKKERKKKNQEAQEVPPCQILGLNWTCRSSASARSQQALKNFLQPHPHFWIIPPWIRAREQDVRIEQAVVTIAGAKLNSLQLKLIPWHCVCTPGYNKTFTPWRTETWRAENGVWKAGKPSGKEH